MLTLAQRLLRRGHPRQDWQRSRCEVPHPRRPRKPLSWLLASYRQIQLRGESKSGGVELDTEDPATFKSFVTWLYTHKLYRPVKTAKFAHGKPLDSYEEILTLWYPGDRREIPLLMHETAKAVRDHAVKHLDHAFHRHRKESTSRPLITHPAVACRIPYCLHEPSGFEQLARPRAGGAESVSDAVVVFDQETDSVWCCER